MTMRRVSVSIVGSEQKLLDAGTVQKMIEFADTDRSDLPKYCGAILANIMTDPAVHDEFVRSSQVSLCYIPLSTRSTAFVYSNDCQHSEQWVRF